MRILCWMGAFWPSIGGVTVHAEQFMPALQERGHDVLAVAFASQDSLDIPYKTQYQKIPLHRIPFWKGHNDVEEMIKIRQQIAGIWRSFKPDLVHKNGVGIGDFFLSAAALNSPAPRVVVLHEDWPNHAETSARETLRCADWVVGVSAAILEHGRKLAPEIIPRSSVIHNALLEPGLRPEPLPRTPRLLCVGRLIREKGFDVALNALASIATGFPGLKLVISGDGPERANLQRQAVELGIDKLVEFTGWISPDAVPALINTATAVLMPCRWQEPFGLVALEAAFMARPIVAAKVGGIPEIVVHDQTGVLVEPENSGALAEAIVRLLKDPDGAESMGRLARQRTLDNFSFQRHVDAYEVVYTRVVTDWHGRTDLESFA